MEEEGSPPFYNTPPLSRLMFHKEIQKLVYTLVFFLVKGITEADRWITNL